MARRLRLTLAQEQILNELKANGVIQTVEAGRIVHRNANKNNPAREEADGDKALERLHELGLAKRGKKGEWHPTAKLQDDA